MTMSHAAEHAFLLSVIDACDDAIVGVRLDGTIVSWNRGAERLYGYPSSRIIGHPLARLSLPEHAEEALAWLAEIRRGRAVPRQTVLQLTASGKTVLVSLSLTPITDAIGEVIGATLVGRDLTEQLEARDHLRSAEEKYRLLFEAESDAILLARLSTLEVIDANPAACRLYGYAPEEWPRLTLYDLIREVQQANDRSGTTGFLQKIPVSTHRRKDGSFFPAEMSISFVPWKGERHLVGIVRDISDRERMRQLDQALTVARGIQQHLLPQAPPQISGLEIAARYIPCEETGGDYYYFISGLPDDRIGLVVGDISGHGIAVSLLMGLLKGLMQASVGRYGQDLTGLFAALNTHLCATRDEDRFATLFYGLLHPTTGDLRWISAAHGPFFQFHADRGKVDLLFPTGPPLGLFPGSDFSPGTPLRLHSGDLLLVGTDGLWEAVGTDGTQYGTDRIRRLLSARAHRLPTDELLEELLADIRRFTDRSHSQDDLTAIAVRVLR